MARRPKEPNRLLAALIEETGCSHKGLARRINDLGESLGLDLHYDHSSVDRWLRGQRPQDPVPNVVANVFSGLLGRRVRPTDLGWTESSAPPALGLEFPLSRQESMQVATMLWQNDMNRRSFLLDSAYALGACHASVARWLTAPGDATAPAVGTRMVGINDVAAIHDVTSLLRSLDNRFGGGRSRPTVLQYLVDEVTPLLRNGRYSIEVGAQLFSAAAELTHLAGWMAYDLEQHGLAQRYMIQALGLARSGGDHALGGEILAGMSHQAVYVSRPGDAVDLARAARITARKAGLAALESEAVVMEAHAHAVRGDRRLATSALGAAERVFDRVNRDVPPWLTYFDTAYLAARIAHCLLALGELSPAESHARRSLDMADGYTRGRMFNVALLARIHARQDHIEQACEEGRYAVRLAYTLQSARTGHYLRELRLELRPHQDKPPVREFTHAARRLPPSRATYTRAST